MDNTYMSSYLLACYHNVGVLFSFGCRTLCCIEMFSLCAIAVNIFLCENFCMMQVDGDELFAVLGGIRWGLWRGSC